MAPSFLIADLMTGEVLEELPFSTFAFEDVVSRPGGWSASIGARHPKVTRSLLKAGERSVWVADGESVAWGGVLWTLKSSSADAALLEVGGQGFLSLFREGRRTIRSRAGMTHASGAIATDITWATTVDLFEIVEDLFAHSLAFAGDADFPLAIALNGPDIGGYSGVSLPTELVVKSDEGRDIGEILDELADTDGGLDYGCSFAWASSGFLAPTLELYWPSRGRVTAHVLEPGKNVTVLNWQEDATEIVHYLEGYGGGEAQSMPVLIDLDLTYVAEGSIPLFQGAMPEKWTNYTPSLVPKVAAELRRRVQAKETFSLELRDTPDVPLGSFIAGDFAYLEAVDGIYEATGLHRLTTVSTRYDGNGKATQAVTAVPASFYEDLL